MATIKHSQSSSPRYPRGWLSVVVMVFALTGGGAVWLYQQSDEWQGTGAGPATSPVPAARMPEHTVGAAAPSIDIDAADNRTDTAGPSPLSLASSNADNKGRPAEVEKPGAEPPLSETSPTETRSDQRAPSSRSTDSPIQSAASSSRTYIIQRGDTLSGIAARLYGDSSKGAAIARVNPGVDPKRLKAGKVIMLPDPEAFEKQPDY
jgi:nucleoid-associated protein YgaU